MPRKKRIDAPGALHHIILRGIERRKIFRDDLDRQNFIDRLGKILTKTSTPCYAWALLPNHAHLLLRSGGVGLSTVMRRLLTGYAVSFNLRHKRHGHLFQNRFRSILCEEETYLLELVRYIHLNPVRAKLTRDVRQLDRYPFAGHSAIMGMVERDWQDVGHVLERFGAADPGARREYRQFVQDGVKQGRRPELVGGGLIRSLGGWSEAKSQMEDEPRMMSDERILGSGDFVESALVAAREERERRLLLRERGHDIESIAEKAASVFEVPVKELYAAGKSRERVRARSVFCYWMVSELGVPATRLARRLGLSPSAVSKAARRGETIVRELGLRLDEP